MCTQGDWKNSERGENWNEIIGKWQETYMCQSRKWSQLEI